MNTSAEKHLAAAKEYVAKGETFYRKAAEEIVAAQKADPTLGAREIGEWFGRSHRWVLDIVTWHTSGKSTRGGGENAPTPYAEQAGAVAQRHARSVLRQAPPEQIAEMLDSPEIRAKVSHAQDIAHSNLQKRSRFAERQALGEEVSDDLAEQQTLRDAEAELFKARRALIETLRLLNQAGGTLTDSWREEFLRTFDDIAAKAELGRGLLVGALDDELDKILAEESR